ncbi:MAG: hypothetical protein WEA09_02260 [Gemmatimonadota bacterium]
MNGRIRGFVTAAVLIALVVGCREGIADPDNGSGFSNLRILQPAENAQFFDTDGKVPCEFSVNNPENRSLTVEWMLSGGPALCEVDMGLILAPPHADAEPDPIPIGEHTITLRVSDGETTLTALSGRSFQL